MPLGNRTVGLLVAVVALLTVAGCLGLGGEDSSSSDAPETASVSEDTGGIEGVVTDEAVQPIPGANVTLVDLDRTTEATEDGAYAFSEVEPGEHTLRVEAEGHLGTEETVSVRAGEVTVRDFVLATETGTEAYTTELELNGFFECGFEVGWNVTGTVPAPPEQAPDPRYFFLGLATCAVPNSVLEEVGAGGNATNDKFAHSFETDPPLSTLVYEMGWEPENQFADWMTTRMEVEGFANDGVGTIFRTQGPSPIHIRLDAPVWSELSENFTAQCEEGDDQYCGYSFDANGFPLQTRVFPAWQCASEQGGGCAVVQQPFTHFITAFYNEPAPQGYRLLGD